MGVHQNVGYDKFPKQGKNLGRLVKVCFNYDTSKIINGIIVRDDREDPGLTIIQLADGRYVLATECQYLIIS
jgi:hypothetical protein